MQWIHNFQLFLFDFDGLLVSTEHLHYQAYVNVLAKRGHVLQLTLADFFQLAHLNATAWKEAVCSAIPNLDWDQVYREKKDAYLDLVITGKVELMPGVRELLTALEQAHIRRCVVTHSVLSHTELVRSQHPILKTIPKWVTREDYDAPKPSPECYLKAIALYGQPGDRIIGFEDSIRGFTALCQTTALPVLICPKHHPLLEMALQKGGLHFESLSEISTLLP